MINEALKYPKDLLSEFSLDQNPDLIDIVKFSSAGEYNAVPSFNDDVLYRWEDKNGNQQYAKIQIELTGRHYDTYDDDGNPLLHGDHYAANSTITNMQNNNINFYGDTEGTPGVTIGFTDKGNNPDETIGYTKESIPRDPAFTFVDRWCDRPPIGYVWHYAQSQFFDNGNSLKVVANMQLVKEDFYYSTLPHCDIIWQIKKINELYPDLFPEWYI